MLQWPTHNQFTTFSTLHERKRGSYNQLQIITTVEDNKYFGLKDERVKKWMTLTYFSFVNNNTSLVNVLANLYHVSLEWKKKAMKIIIIRHFLLFCLESPIIMSFQHNEPIFCFHDRLTKKMKMYKMKHRGHGSFFLKVEWYSYYIKSTLINLNPSLSTINREFNTHLLLTSCCFCLQTSCLSVIFFSLSQNRTRTAKSHKCC